MVPFNYQNTSRWRFWSMTLVSILVLVGGCAGAIPKEKSISSQFLATCMANSQFVVSDFFFLYTPGNSTLQYSFQGTSSIEGNVIISLEIIVYGYSAHTEKFDPCASNMRSLCPMQPGAVVLGLNSRNISEFANKIPSQAFSVPDIDGLVRIKFTSSTGIQVACLEAELSNSQTVHQNGVGWATALITGSSLLVSGIASAFGHTKAAGHIATIALSLFGYFQSQVIFAMVAVKLPPIARSWLQNLSWSMGIIRVGFMQSVLSWYIDATGGTPDLNPRVNRINVQIAKRDLQTAAPPQPKSMIVTGVSRLAFLSAIAKTNLFMTSLGFFISLIVVVILVFVSLNLVFRIKGARKSKFAIFERNWSGSLKGIIYRIISVGFPQLAALCLWELTSRDSPAIVVLAIAFFLISLSLLSWASYKILTSAHLSISYQDQAFLSKWGFLYTQFKSSNYFWIILTVIYALIKGCFIAFAQSNGLLQSIALLIIELAYLVAISWIRPFLDRKINTINICICVANVINAIMLVFFGISKGPSLVRSILGVVLFVMNAIFVLVLLVLILIAAIHAIFAENPDSRYQHVQDNKHNSKIDKGFDHSVEFDALNTQGNHPDMVRSRFSNIDENGYRHEHSGVNRELNAPKLSAIQHKDHNSNRPALAYGNGSRNIRSSNLATRKTASHFSN
ncbi:hypothetical protein TWF694_005852 [Orbilia ellipsospora]|uniref:ML-like domain-containing protein n=1 Tax=Orbilia ellipsospora TaxID=2528407 RepID=A0AAV9WS37_9PEZI